MAILQKAKDFVAGAIKGGARTLVDNASLLEQTRGATGLVPLDFLVNKLQNRAVERITGRKPRSIRQTYENIPESVRKPKNPAQKAGFITEQVAEFVAPVAAGAKISKITRTPLTKIAEGLYRRALKPSTRLSRQEVKDVVQTGLRERIWLSENGIEKIQDKIDTLENRLGEVIAEKGKLGVKLSLEKVDEFVGGAKKFFTNLADPKLSKEAIDEIDGVVTRFKEAYSKEDGIPIEIAQEIKRSTMRYLKKYYGKLSGASEEGMKQLARFLRVGIENLTEKEAGEINSRLAGLLKLDTQLEGAVARIANSSGGDLGTQVATAGGAVIGQAPGAALGLVASEGFKLTRSSKVRAGTAIVLSELDKIAKEVAERGQVPVALLIEKILAATQQGDD